MRLEKYSFGIGDRFGQECLPQLAAIELARKNGIPLIPVWNKSFREHSIIGSNPENTQKIVDSAIKEYGWKNSYYIDADHINLKSVDYFMNYANFFTLDVGEFINKKAEEDDKQNFIKNFSSLIGTVEIPGLPHKYEVTN